MRHDKQVTGPIVGKYQNHTFKENYTDILFLLKVFNNLRENIDTTCALNFIGLSHNVIESPGPNLRGVGVGVGWAYSNDGWWQSSGSEIWAGSETSMAYLIVYSHQRFIIQKEERIMQRGGPMIWWSRARSASSGPCGYVLKLSIYIKTLFGTKIKQDKSHVVMDGTRLQEKSPQDEARKPNNFDPLSIPVNLHWHWHNSMIMIMSRCHQYRGKGINTIHIMIRLKVVTISKPLPCSEWPLLSNLDSNLQTTYVRSHRF